MPSHLVRSTRSPSAATLTAVGVRPHHTVVLGVFIAFLSGACGASGSTTPRAVAMPTTASPAVGGTTPTQIGSDDTTQPSSALPATTTSTESGVAAADRQLEPYTYPDGQSHLDPPKKDDRPTATKEQAYAAYLKASGGKDYRAEQGVAPTIKLGRASDAGLIHDRLVWAIGYNGATCAPSKGVPGPCMVVIWVDADSSQLLVEHDFGIG